MSLIEDGLKQLNIIRIMTEHLYLTTPEIPKHTIMLFACHPKILHKHCDLFLLGVKMAPRETERVLWYVMVFSGVVNSLFQPMKKNQLITKNTTTLNTFSSSCVTRCSITRPSDSISSSIVTTSQPPCTTDGNRSDLILSPKYKTYRGINEHTVKG